MTTTTTTTTYWINTIDSDVWPAWASLCATVTPAAQDSGRCAYRATTARAGELEAALEADDGVIEYRVEG